MTSRDLKYINIDYIIFYHIISNHILYIKTPSAAVMKEDAADVARRQEMLRIEEEQAELARRSSVLQRDFPRPPIGAFLLILMIHYQFLYVFMYIYCKLIYIYIYIYI